MPEGFLPIAALAPGVVIPWASTIAIKKFTLARVTSLLHYCFHTALNTFELIT